ncbi:zinc carboxypeptidase [Cercophora newfieldiana]|uniref:Zinc carboxypeptidase n=1 Tax=Cercophora newfieldiana TaxID=92897 RepID=A0AA39YT09_9PEZI|nr:zinc carboxypeptidase [Cercophora newfieldiana]
MRLPTLVSLITHLSFASSCLLEIERNGGHVVDRSEPLRRRQAPDNSVPVGSGDRFNNGAIVPRGLGVSPPTEPSDIYNLVEIKSAVKALCQEFNLPYFEAPYRTYENRTVFGFRVGGKPNKPQNKGYQVMLESAIHARERGGPDHLLNFVSDLLFAKRANVGLTYGGVAYTAQDVRTVLDLGLVIIPVVNPDGVAYDQSTNLCWRKNRNPTSAIPGNPNSVGVDLNRNFSPVWNFTKAMVPGVQAASEDPANEQFHGTGPLSEPETKNVDWVMSQHSELGWFIDQHSVAGVVIHGWCHDSNQVSNPAMNFLNPAYDGKRGALPDTLSTMYREYIKQRDWDDMSITAARIAGAMTDSTARAYVAMPAANFYPSSGCSADQGNFRAAMASGPASRMTIRGFGLEFGMPKDPAGGCPFYPTAQEHKLNMVENGAGFMAFLLNAARLS